MAATGGFFPYDELNALVGPARTLVQPIDGDVAADITDIIAVVADEDGEYLAEGEWRDTGLSAEAPSLTHNRDTAGIDYEQVSNLFQKITDIERTVTLQIAEFSIDNLILAEATLSEMGTINAAANKSSQKSLGVGVYQSLPEIQIALLFLRPDGAGVVTEPDGTQRPPYVCRYIPRASLAAEESEMEFSREDPTNIELVFNILPASGTDAGEEHGQWFLEDAGQTIAGT